MMRASADAVERAPVDVNSLFREHAQRVARWASRLGGPGVDVEDVVQEVFMRAYRHRDQFRGDASITTWLFRITARQVARLRRLHRARQLWRSLYAHDPMPAHPPTPVEELERRREGERLRRAIDTLGESPRTVFILFELEGLSGEQIAELTGLKIDTIWVQLHRARARIRKRLAKEDRRG
jgi:RNA polymerase sigma-70 factor (ECF subfamily)